MGNSDNVTKFVKTVNDSEVSKTFGEVLNIHASGQVAFHIIGAYLNKLGGNGASIPDAAVTLTAIVGIWDEYATKGYYEPSASVKWYAEDIKTYLTSNGLVA